MKKIVNISDVCLNYDFALTLHKMNRVDSLEGVAVKKFEDILADAKAKSVSYIVLSGELFDEETLTIEEVDYVVALFQQYSDIRFIIAPVKELAEDSWYFMINWPSNVHGLFKDNSFAKFEEDKLLFYINALNESLLELEYDMICITDVFGEEAPVQSNNDYVFVTNQSFRKENDVSITPGSLFPREYNVNKENGYYMVTLDEKNTCSFIPSTEVKLLATDLQIHPHMSLEDIIHQTESAILDDAANTFYQITYKGMIGKDIPVEFVRNVKERLLAIDRCELLNKTNKDYNIEAILEANKENLIGLFIEDVQNENIDDKDKQKIIEYGLDYLL